MEHRPHCEHIVLLHVVFVCKCVPYYCHLVSNELKSTNASINLYLSIKNINVVEMDLADLSNYWKHNDK